MNQAFLDLKSIFGNPATLPKGKILLSYRKEYQPEIEEYCKKYELSRSKVFIEHISKNDIVELFQGFMQSPRLMSRYNLTIENGLPELIADDLAADKDAPVAPMLQILLTKMWNKAVALHPEAPVFTHDLYHELKEEGLAMDEFLLNQLQSIKKKLPEAHDLGFVVDMLAFHCTANNTSAARTEKELMVHYPFAIDAAKKVLAACKDSFLITDLGGNEHSSMLAHDTLAKSVIKAQQRSTQPIQQGKRILSSRIEAIKAGSEFATMDSWELKLIEKIQTYLPAFDEGEKKLFDSSRKEIDKQERQRRRIVNSRRTIIALSILSGIVAWYLFAQSKKHEKASFVSLMTVSSGMNIEKDPTLAISQALSGLQKDSNSLELKKMLLRAYYYSADNKLAWYNTIYQSSEQFTDLKYNPRVDLMILFSESDTLMIIDSKGKANGRLVAVQDSMNETNEKNLFTEVRWTRDGQSIIAIDKSLSLYFFTNDGKLINQWSPYLRFDYNDTIDNAIALSARSSGHEHDSELDIFDQRGNKIDSFNILDRKQDGMIYHIYDFTYAGNGKNLLVRQFSIDTSNLVDGRLHLLNLDSKLRLDSSWVVSEYYASSLGKLFVVCNNIRDKNGAHTCIIRNMKGKSIGKLSKSNFKNISFHPSDSMYLYFDHNSVIAYNIPLLRMSVVNHDKEINVAHFSPLNNLILTGGADNIGKVSSIQGVLQYSLRGHALPVTGIEMNGDQKTVFTSSLDGTIRSWDLISFDHTSIHHPEYEYVDRVISDPSGNYLLVPAVGLGQNKVYNLATNKEVKWNCRMYPYYNRWHFLDSSHIVGVADEEPDQPSKVKVHLFKPEVDSPIILLNGRGNNVGLLNHQIVITTKDSIRFMSMDGLFIKSVSIDHSDINGFQRDCFSPNQMMLAVAFSRPTKHPAPMDNSIAVFDHNGLKIHEFKSAIINLENIHFSNHNDRLVSFASDGSIQINYLDGRPTLIKKRQDCSPSTGGCSILDFHFSPDDAMMISSSSDGLVRIWDSVGNMINSFQSNSSNTSLISDANFTPEGKLIYSYDSDTTTLNLWDFQGNLIFTYNGHTAFFTPDGNRLYTIINPWLGKYNPKSQKSSELRDYLTPQGAYNYFKSNNTFTTKKDNSLYSTWHRLLEWLGLE